MLIPLDSASSLPLVVTPSSSQCSITTLQIRTISKNEGWVRSVCRTSYLRRILISVKYSVLNPSSEGLRSQQVIDCHGRHSQTGHDAPNMER